MREIEQAVGVDESFQVSPDEVPAFFGGWHARVLLTGLSLVFWGFAAFIWPR